MHLQCVQHRRVQTTTRAWLVEAPVCNKDTWLPVCGLVCVQYVLLWQQSYTTAHVQGVQETMGDGPCHQGKSAGRHGQLGKQTRVADPVFTSLEVGLVHVLGHACQSCMACRSRFFRCSGGICWVLRRRH